MEFTPMQKLSFVVLRTMSSLIFITVGLNHLFKTEGAAAKLQQSAFGYLVTAVAPAEPLIVVSGIGLLAGGFMLFVGFKTRLASLGLLVILFPITITIQVANPAGSGPLFKNIALMGVLFFFIVNGAVYYGLDQATILKNKALAMVHRKNSIPVLATGLLVLLNSCASTTGQTMAEQGATIAGAKQKYAVLISQPNHLRAALHTAETITKDPNYNSGAFVIMACGKSVEALKKDVPTIALLDKGKALGITFKICGMSLEQFNLSKSDMADGLDVVPNGLTYMFDLQQQGYKTVEL